MATGHPQKLDPWLLDNARIGPDSPIELAPGSSYSPRVEYPNPDGPMSPLPAKIVWSIAPVVEGINIDSDTGKIIVDSSVPAGTTAIVHAEVNGGARKLSAKLVVFSAAENPLRGDWLVKSVIACDGSQKVMPPISSPQMSDHVKFYVDRKIWIGRPFGIAATTRLTGDYQVDLKAQMVKLIPSWPKGKAAEEWKFELAGEGEMKWTLPDAIKDEKTQVCGYRLSRNSASRNPGGR